MEAHLAKHSSQVLEMARKGAEHTYEELQSQLMKLVKDFPHLAKRTVRSVARSGTRRVKAVEADAPKIRRRRRSKLSAAGRAAISAAQKKRWAVIKKKRAASAS